MPGFHASIIPFSIDMHIRHEERVHLNKGTASTRTFIYANKWYRRVGFANSFSDRQYSSVNSEYLTCRSIRFCMM